MTVHLALRTLLRTFTFSKGNPFSTTHQFFFTQCLGHDYVGAEHLLLGIISERDSLPVRVLDSLLVDLNDLKKRVEKIIPRYSAYPPADNLNIGDCAVTTQTQRVLKATFVEAKMMKSEEVHPEHLMMSLRKHPDTAATRILNEFDVDYDSFKKELEYVRSEQDLSHPNLYSQAEGSGDYEEDEERSRGFQSGQKAKDKSKTPVLDNFGRDITKLQSQEEEQPDPDWRARRG